jgi:MFS family permease
MPSSSSPEVSVAIVDDNLHDYKQAEDLVDPLRPRTWPRGKKWYLSGVMAMIALSVYIPHWRVLWMCRSVGTSMYLPATPQMEEEWDTTQTVLLLGITVYSCCYSIGPPIFAPISETVGRLPLYLLTWSLYTGNMFLVAFSQVSFAPIFGLTGQNVPMFLICRTISGLSGVGAYTIPGGTLSDLWTPAERGQSLSFFAATSLLGPCLGPVLGSLIVENIAW